MDDGYWTIFIIRWYQRLVIGCVVYGLSLLFFSLLGLHFPITIALLVAMALASSVPTRMR